MTNAIDFYNNYNPDDAQDPKSQSNITFAIPDETRPLIFKILPDFRYGNGKSWYRPLRSFTFQAGPSEKDKRKRPCLTFFGETVSPELEYYKKLKQESDAMNKLGQGNSAEAVVLKSKLAIFKPSDMAYILYIEPGSPEIKAMKVSVSVINCIKGREANQYSPAIPSLIKSMAADGVSPFDIFSPKAEVGWVKLWKTGEGLGTRYHVAVDEKTLEIEQNGKKYYSKEMTTHKVHEKIAQRKFVEADFPDVLAFEERNRWTPTELERFIESEGTQVPERFLKKEFHGQQNGGSGSDQVAAVTPFDTGSLIGSLDDIPL
jgi:hypothetical protein